MSLQGAVPEVWVADRYAGQGGHGVERQLCRALLLRDAQYAIGRQRETLKDSTLGQYRADLDRRLTTLLGQPPTASAGRKLARAIRKCRNDLFLFVTRRDVPYTNNGCQRALRPSVIFRKVTGCFQSHWGARLYAAAASVIATARLSGNPLSRPSRTSSPHNRPLSPRDRDLSSYHCKDAFPQLPVMIQGIDCSLSISKGFSPLYW